MKVHKNTLKKIRRLIEDALDTDKTPTFDESIESLLKAIDELSYLIDGAERW